MAQKLVLSRGRYSPIKMIVFFHSVEIKFCIFNIFVLMIKPSCYIPVCNFIDHCPDDDYEVCATFC